jgi:hypothetical protein
MKPLLYFLVRYWLLVVLTPSIVIPTFSFFHNFTDMADFSISAIGSEIIKYLVPAILIFSAVSVVLALLFILTDLLILPVMLKNLRFWSFKIIFIITGSFLIVTPAVIWYLLQKPINFHFINTVIPAYVISGVFWGALLIGRKAFDSLKPSW